MRNLELALIGNCSIGALVDSRAAIVWYCTPRLDGEPVFDCLLRRRDEAGLTGSYAIELENFERSEQQYLENTAVLQTRLYDSAGGCVEICDFAPRFKQFGRTFRPVMLVRRLRPLAGSPRIRIRLRPVHNGSDGAVSTTQGSNHIRYVLPDQVLRLTTNASITAVRDELPFVLEHETGLLLGPDETLTTGIREATRHLFEETCSYWEEWSRYLGVPFEWQEEVIRAAITLKLNAYEDTGAVIAAVTTSIPEAPDSGRNWDYRYCWLRDAHFVVSALNRLGTTSTMEHYLGYIVNVVASADGNDLQPVYCINGTPQMPERELAELPGYRGMGPVRIGNQAYLQKQYDVYGAAILAATQMFIDRRIVRRGDVALFHRLEALGEKARERYDQPDAGPWELRGSTSVHTYSSVMCWAGCDRLAHIAAFLGLTDRAAYWRASADAMHAEISRRAWNAGKNSFVDAFDGEHLDASLLLLHELGFVSAKDPRFAGTVAAVECELRRGDFLFRYVKSDDFGFPETAFTVCTFWYIDALAAIGRRAEARRLFERLLACRNSHGLLSEDLDPATGELWGNFPQTYSMVGLINSAMRLSKPWEEAFS